MVRQPENWPWSSYRAMTGLGRVTRGWMCRFPRGRVMHSPGMTAGRGAGFNRHSGPPEENRGQTAVFLRKTAVCPRFLQIVLARRPDLQDFHLVADPVTGEGVVEIHLHRFPLDPEDDARRFLTGGVRETHYGARGERHVLRELRPSTLRIRSSRRGPKACCGSISRLSRSPAASPIRL